MSEVMNENVIETKEVKLTTKDFVPAGDVRWQFLIPQTEINANPAIAGQQNPLQ